mmetsp:Transcript_8631/g.13278  ORF Transcript_8631/g.13278 Transcript_8631/m.13278 type:complete len:365 (+) Transcript_8631:137-1231(+)
MMYEISFFFVLLFNVVLGVEVSTFRLLKRLTPFFDEAEMQKQSDRKYRIYANESKINIYTKAITRDDLFTKPAAERQSLQTVWITAPYRATMFAIAYSAYPTIILFFRSIVPEAETGESTALISSFAPAISLLYGAWLSVTFSILEERTSSLQRTVTEESALLHALCRRTAKLVHANCLKEITEKEEALFAPIFEQTTILACRSREDELLAIANEDVYHRFDGALLKNSIFDAGITDLVDRLTATRAVRLTKETKSLPAAHFVVLATFSFQLLFCFIYAAALVPTPSDNSVLRVAFALFFSVNVLVFNFSLDLNDPFRGNYQIRRSAINANLIATRRIIADVIGSTRTRMWETELKDNITRSEF